jgi:hypothetical protein
MIVAAFPGDSANANSTAISRGTVLIPEVSSAVDNLKATMEALQISVSSLSEKIDNLRDAISSGNVGASVSITMEAGAAKVENDFQTDVTVIPITLNVENIEVEVGSTSENGKTIVINIDEQMFPNLEENVAQGTAEVRFDNQKITQADNYEDVLDPNNDSGPEFLILKGTKGVQLLVSIPAFSNHRISVSTLPTLPSAPMPPIYLVLVAVFVLAGSLAAVIWRYLSLGTRRLKVSGRPRPRAKIAVVF